MSTAYWKTGLTGGTATDMDGITSVAADDMCFVATVNNFLYYVAKDDGATEDVPWVVDPDEAGTLRWHLQQTGYQLVGNLIRPTFLYSTTTNIQMRTGFYNLYGRGWVGWDSTLTYTFTPPTSDIDFLYLDYSAISTSGIITNAELTEDTTVPAYSAAKGGWYNGDDRCIFAIYGNGAGEVSPFLHDGDLVIYDDRIISSATVPTASFADYTILGIPDTMCRRALVRTYLEDTGTKILYGLRKNATGTTGRILNYVKAGATISSEIHEIEIETGSAFQLKLDTATATTFSLQTLGWFLPEYM